MFLCAAWAQVNPQTPLIDGEDDPVKLFERGQDAHAKNNYAKAIEYYDAAIKLRPEFPEAEYQRAMALLVSKRKQEAIEGFNRAVALRPDWAFAYASFGSLISSYFNDDRAGEPILRRAIELEPGNVQALVALADLRARAGDHNEALVLSRSATASAAATSSTWRKRSFIEIAAGDKIAALASIDKALSINPNDGAARYDRARLRLDAGDREGAFADLKIHEQTWDQKHLPSTFELSQLYARAGRRDDALRVLDALSEADRRVPEVIALRAELVSDGGTSTEERAALEELLQRDPKNVSLLARLGNAYRQVDPLKSQDYFYRALQIEPTNIKHAIGYAAALVQARRFADAVGVLRRIIEKAPNEYFAHTNLALALFELKDFRSALVEYEWVSAARPELAAPYFFIAAAHDNLQQYEQALEAYDKFLARADPTANKLEIEKLHLRLPALRDQIKRGQGVKRKRS